MKIPLSEIKDVTDTALWVAAYRAEESSRRDALFRDEFASLLTGDLGSSIATRTQGSRYTAWSVVIRTYIIDNFIINLLPKGIDTVLNLGAGLDTRPYRLDLHSDLRWIEVDFPNIIEQKNEKLKTKSPRCKLERLSLDLSDKKTLDSFFKDELKNSKNILVLTEGVIPYLSNDDASSLASSLYEQHNIKYWISEYYSPEILKFLRTPKRLEQMKNSPFLFYPEDWFKFFLDHGWENLETKYFGIESEKLGRTPPRPGWIKGQSDETLINSLKFYLGYTIYKKLAV